MAKWRDLSEAEMLLKSRAIREGAGISRGEFLRRYLAGAMFEERQGNRVRYRETGKSDRRQFLRTGAAVAVMAGAGAGVIASVCTPGGKPAHAGAIATHADESKHLYSFAKQDERLRQEYLDKIWAEENLGLCERLVYDPDASRFKKYVTDRNWGHLLRQDIYGSILGSSYAQIASLPDHKGKHFQMPIFVGRRAFETIRYDNIGFPGLEYHDEVVSVIVDHEYVHIDQEFNGTVVGNHTIDYRMADDLLTGRFPHGLVTAIDESRAYGNQAVQILNGRRRVQPRFYNAMKKQYMKHHSQLEHFVSIANRQSPFGALVYELANTVLHELKQVHPDKLPGDMLARR